MRTRHTFNVNAAMHGDTAKLIRVLQAWQPPALVCMGALNAGDPSNIVVRLRDVLREWGGIIVYRHFERGEAALWNLRSVDADIDMRLSWNAAWAWHYVGNEPGPDDPDEIKRMSDWYAEYARKAPARGLCCVLPGGFATASFEPEQLSLLDTMMHSIGEQREERREGWNVVGFGTHEYAHVDPRFFVPGEDLHKLKDKARMQGPYKSRAEIFALPLSEFHVVLRTERYLAQMARLCGITRAALTIDVHDTECVVERLPHVEQQFPDVAAYIDSQQGEKTYGLPKVGNYWRKMFDKDPQEVMTDICVYMENIYPEQYRYFAHYSYTTHNTEPHFWHERYSVIEAERWHAALPEAVAKGKIPVTVADVKKPVDCGLPIRAKVHTPTSINIRNAPQKFNTRVEGAAKEGDVLDYFPDTKREGEGLDWYFVEMLTAKGWMARVWPTIEQQFENIEVPTTPPDDEDDEPTDPPEVPGTLYAPLTRDEMQQIAVLHRQVETALLSVSEASGEIAAIYEGAAARMAAPPPDADFTAQRAKKPKRLPAPVIEPIPLFTVEPAWMPLRATDFVDGLDSFDQINEEGGALFVITSPFNNSSRAMLAEADGSDSGVTAQFVRAIWYLDHWKDGQAYRYEYDLLLPIGFYAAQGDAIDPSGWDCNPVTGGNMSRLTIYHGDGLARIFLAVDGKETQVTNTFRIPEAQPVHIAIEQFLSQGADGWTRVYMDGALVASGTGQTKGPYDVTRLRFGLAGTGDADQKLPISLIIGSPRLYMGSAEPVIISE